MSSSGNHTKELITDVSSKLRLPKDRSTGISYVRALLIIPSWKIPCTLIILQNLLNVIAHFREKPWNISYAGALYLLINVRPCMLSIKGSFQKGSILLCPYNPCLVTNGIQTSHYEKKNWSRMLCSSSFFTQESCYNKITKVFITVFNLIMLTLLQYSRNAKLWP